MVNYKTAIRENWKFQTNVGVITVSQLFNASDDTLTELENSLKDEVKTAKKPNRFQKSEIKSKTLKMKLEIVSDVIDTIIEEREIASNEVENKLHNQKIQGIIKRKRDAELEEMSAEELEKMLKK